MRICLVVSQFEKLGVEYVSAALKNAGHELCMAYDPRLFVDAFNVNEPMARRLSLEREVVDQASASRADVYAFACLSADWAWAKRMTTAVKRATGKPIVIGGLHVSAATRLVLEHTDIDYTVTGEAEEAVCDLMAALEDGRDAGALANVGCRRDGEIVINPNRPLLENLDELPHPDKQIYYETSSHFAYGYNVMAARGCPKACSYCFNSWYRHQFPNKKKWVRARSVDNVIEELERAKTDYAVEHFRMLDDDFVYDPDWFAHFAEEYRKRIRVPYRAFVDADSCSDEVVRMLDASGCFEVEMGVQTIKHDIRTKLFTRAQIEGQCKAAIDRFARSRVTCVADNIFGYPGQTPDDMAELLSFYNETRPARVQNLWLRYWPGATIVDIARASGFLTDAEVREVYENPTDRGCVIGNVRKEPWTQRTSCFLYLSLHMPRWFNAFWIRDRRFARFPLLPDFVSYVLSNSLGAKINMYGRRFAERYARYGLYRLAGRFRPLLERHVFGGKSPLVSHVQTSSTHGLYRGHRYSPENLRSSPAWRTVLADPLAQAVAP